MDRHQPLDIRATDVMGIRAVGIWRRPRAALATIAIALFATPAVAHATNYSALGDSYSSGVGTRTYYSDSGNCQRGPNAYPVKVAAQLRYSLNFAACSDAKTGDVINNQLGGLNGSTNFVTISIGGNDAGFSNVITKCAQPWPWNCDGDITNAQNFIRNNLPGLLDNTLGQIRSRAPNAKIVLVGYPRLFNGQNCNSGTHFSPSEESRLNQTADILAGVESGRAGANGDSFVDPRNAFVGHAVCDNPEWLNGLSNPVSESYHPNVSGHVAYTSLVAPVLH